MALINWLLKSKCMLKHIYIFCRMKIRQKCDDFFLIFKRLGRMHENKIYIFFIYIFLQFSNENWVF
jgi:hypothetical protein